jgi:hypothetical protein
VRYNLVKEQIDKLILKGDEAVGIYYKLYIGINCTPQDDWTELVQWKGTLPPILRETVFKDIPLINKVFQLPIEEAYDRIQKACEGQVLDDKQKTVLDDIYDNITHEGRNSGIDSRDDVFLILDLSDAIDQNYWKEERGITC